MRAATLLSAILGVLLLLSATDPFRAVRVPAALGQTEANPPAPAAGDAGEVIPPGQEALLAQMLGQGATLPGECRFTGGEANGPLVRSTYTCANGEVVFELRHPSDASTAAARTAKFALIVRSGSPPPGLIDAVVSLIRSHEATFEWNEIHPPSRRPSLGRILLPGAGLLGIAALGWALRRRRSARRARA
jgi:hypothetical protein